MKTFYLVSISVSVPLKQMPISDSTDHIETFSESLEFLLMYNEDFSGIHFHILLNLH